MRHQAYNDRLDSNDRKKFRRIFYQMVRSAFATMSIWTE